MMLSRVPVIASWRRIERLQCFCGFRDFSSSPEEDDKAPPPPTTTTDKPPSIVPGVALSAVTCAAGFEIASLLSSSLGVPVSGIPVSILLGMGIKNTVGYSEPTFKPGITFATKTILQGGIVCVAAKLSFFELLSVGGSGIPVVVSAVGAGCLFIPMAGKLAKLPEKMTLLLTAGTSICGVTAITALAPAIGASNRDTAVAVANTVAFGTIGMLAYPYLFHAICSSSEQVGMCLGVAIHDTSQVLGAAMSYRDAFDDDVALRVAAVTKLTRNLGLAVVIPALTYVSYKETATASNVHVQDKMSKGDTLSGLLAFQKYVPPFLIAFIGMAAARSCGDAVFGVDAPALYHQTVNFIGNDVSKYTLGTAMAGVGLSTSASSLKGVGWRPFAVGGLGSLVLGATGFAAASLIV